MAKVNNVGLSLNHKIANPFKTSRNSTNPFKYQDFEGNTLDLDPLAFADVLQVSNGPAFKGNKLKMISSSVAGSMTKLRLPETITAFVNRVRAGITNVWNYAKNKEVTKFGSYKPITDAMNTDIVDIGRNIGTSVANLGKGVRNSVSGLGHGISEGISYLNRDITEIGKDLSSKWTVIVNRVKPHTNKITKETPVCELRAMWVNENALEEGRMVA